MGKSKSSPFYNKRCFSKKERNRAIRNRNNGCDEETYITQHRSFKFEKYNPYPYYAGSRYLVPLNEKKIIKNGNQLSKMKHQNIIEYNNDIERKPVDYRRFNRLQNLENDKAYQLYHKDLKFHKNIEDNITERYRWKDTKQEEIDFQKSVYNETENSQLKKYLSCSIKQLERRGKKGQFKGHNKIKYAKDGFLK
tara:strand:- start:525 stop:1106 length:582 start_codon:yes stop_codon:yes gene_type:complete